MGTRNITIKRGDFKAIKIILPLVDEFGDSITWAGATFIAQIRKTKAKTAPLLAAFVVDTAHIGEDPPYVVLTIESATVGNVVGTTDLPAPSQAFWDFQETRNGKPRTPAEGKVKITEDVSR